MKDFGPGLFLERGGREKALLICRNYEMLEKEMDINQFVHSNS